MSKKLAGLVLWLCIAGSTICAAAPRHYYITAEDAIWDYAPSHRDLIHATELPVIWAQKTAFRKTRFIEYSDATFTTKKPQPEWLGILGPVMRAEVGDRNYRRVS